MTKYNWAIIGFGGMGNWHYDNVQARIPEMNTKGIFDVRQEAIDTAKEKGLNTYKSLEDLLDDKEIDIVTIATPNNYHKDLAIKAMRSGKNVVCEKPVTLNAAELEEIIAVSKETGKLFSVHQNRRWDKDYCIVKSILDSGTIGTPYFIETRVQGSRGAMHGWRGFKINGGGMLLDWGVHLLDQLMDMIPAKVVSVNAHLKGVFSNEVDDNIKIMLRFANDATAIMEMSTNCFINLPRWHVTCTGGTAIIEDWSCAGKIVKLNDNSELEWDDVIVYTEAGPTRTMAPRPKETTHELPLPSVETDWTDYYKNIIDVLEKKAELIVKPEQCLRVMKVIDLLFESERTRNCISCEI